MFESPTTHIELRENCNELLFQEDLYIERKTKVLDDNHVLTRHGMGWSPREDSNSYLYERPGPNDGPERVEKYESDRNEWWELAPTLQGHTVDTEIRQALTWLALCAPRTRLNHRRTSYGWKHNAENYDSGLFPDHCYVSNGGLICAALMVGLKWNWNQPGKSTNISLALTAPRTCGRGTGRGGCGKLIPADGSRLRLCPDCRGTKERQPEIA